MFIKCSRIVFSCLLLICLSGVLPAVDWNGPRDVKLPFSCPNPFYNGMESNTVKFVFDPNISGTVELRMYNASGNLVAMAFGTATGGDSTADYVEWDGRNWAGKRVAKGAYIYIITVTDPVSKKVEVHKGICFKM